MLNFKRIMFIILLITFTLLNCNLYVLNEEVIIFCSIIFLIILSILLLKNYILNYNFLTVEKLYILIYYNILLSKINIENLKHYNNYNYYSFLNLFYWYVIICNLTYDFIYRIEIVKHTIKDIIIKKIGIYFNYIKNIYSFYIIKSFILKNIIVYLNNVKIFI